MNQEGSVLYKVFLVFGTCFAIATFIQGILEWPPIEASKQPPSECTMLNNTITLRECNGPGCRVRWVAEYCPVLWPERHLTETLQYWNDMGWNPANYSIGAVVKCYSVDVMNSDYPVVLNTHQVFGAGTLICFIFTVCCYAIPVLVGLIALIIWGWNRWQRKDYDKIGVERV